MTDQEILAQIKELVDAEHRLRSATAHGDLDPAAEQAQLTRIEQTLDQCWDLLRQRRARVDADESPDAAQPNSVGQVEGYLQ